jgi:hypothetical protein
LPRTRYWRIGGARRRAGPDALSPLHGYGERGAVAGLSESGSARRGRPRRSRDWFRGKALAGAGAVEYWIVAIAAAEPEPARSQKHSCGQGRGCAPRPGVWGLRRSRRLLLRVRAAVW